MYSLSKAIPKALETEDLVLYQHTYVLVIGYNDQTFQGRIYRGSALDMDMIIRYSDQRREVGVSTPRCLDCNFFMKLLGYGDSPTQLGSTSKTSECPAEWELPKNCSHEAAKAYSHLLDV